MRGIRWDRVGTWAAAAPLGLAPWLAWRELGNYDKGELVGAAFFAALLVLWAVVLLWPPERVR